MPRKFTIDRARAEQIATASETAFEAARQANADLNAILAEVARLEAVHRQRSIEAGGRYSPSPDEIAKIARLRAGVPEARGKVARASEVSNALGNLASRVGELTASPRRSLGGIEIARSL